MKHLLNMLDGFRIVRDVHVYQRTYRTNLVGGFKSDHKALKGDFGRVGRDVSKSVEKTKNNVYGETYTASGSLTQW